MLPTARSLALASLPAWAKTLLSIYCTQLYSDPPFPLYRLYVQPVFYQYKNWGELASTLGAGGAIVIGLLVGLLGPHRTGGVPSSWHRLATWASVASD